MEQIAQSSIFFIITSISVVVVTILVVAVLLYVLRIVRDVRSVTNKIKQGSDSLSGDMGEVREQLKRKGVLSGFIIAVLTALVGAHKSKKKKSKGESE